MSVEIKKAPADAGTSTGAMMSKAHHENKRILSDFKEFGKGVQPWKFGQSPLITP